MWSVATYQDTDAMIEPPLWRVALFELMRGVNEREAAIDVAKTEFYKGDGSRDSDLEMSDLVGLSLVGLSMKNNLILIKLFIVNNAQYFTQSSGVSDVWSVDLLEAEIGEEIDYVPTRPLSARFWQAMQDALDLLIYARRRVAANYLGVTTYNRGYVIGGAHIPGASPSAAWSALLSHGDLALTYGDPYFNQSFNLSFGIRGYLFGGSTHEAVSTRLVENIKFSNAFSGIGTALQYQVGVYADSTLLTSAMVSIGSIAPIDVFDYKGLFSASLYFTAEDLDLPIGGDGYINAEIELPASTPFDEPPTLNSLRHSATSLFNAIYYFDISSELSDKT